MASLNRLLRMMTRPAHIILIALMLLSGGVLHAANAFDIDGDGETDALTDGLLVLRYFFGFSGSTLIEGAVASGATRSTATDIESYIESIELYLDIDQDGSTGALTDGLLLLRYLFGFSGETLVAGALGGSATQTLPDDIAAYVQGGGVDTDEDGVGDAIDAFPTDPAEWTDTDGDGIGNNADGDDDGDGVVDDWDTHPLDSSRPPPLVWDSGNWDETKWN